MQIIQTAADLRRVLAGSRNVTLVPTMGNLHEGHLSLVRIARERDGEVVASVFVNPLQFAPHEDFATYPRTLERDCELLAAGGCDIVFAPSEQEVYPVPQVYKVHPPAGLAGLLGRKVRPGFFLRGLTGVLKPFNMGSPPSPGFEKKEHQQTFFL